MNRRYVSGCRGSKFRPRKEHIIGSGAEYYKGKGELRRTEMQKRNQGTWKRILKETRQRVHKLEENCKENLKSSGQKRVRGQNEREGKQQWVEVTVKIVSVKKFS